MFDTIKNIVEDETMSTMLEKWASEREAKGKAETVLTVLKARFTKVPQQVEDSIRQMTDVTALDSWAAHAATCKSLDEFAKALE